MQKILDEFPVSELQFGIPKWTELLPKEHPVKQGMIQNAKEMLGRFIKMKDLKNAKKQLFADELYRFRLEELSMESGVAQIKVDVAEK